MLDIREIEYWISKYEKEADKLDHCVTLSALYGVRDHINGQPLPAPSYGQAPPPEPAQALGVYGESEFLRAVSGKDPHNAWNVMDELMETLQAVNPRVYASVMRKMAAL